MKQRVHLIANAHIDPIWQWEIDEGISAALSTFTSAVTLLKEFDYVFCHNEAFLYQWIERNDLVLFEKIKEQCRQDKWHIMGGWYVQPDCNMPCGESFIRQMAYGKAYFHKKFGKTPQVAINFDSFGHSRGLVQILKKGGYKGYMFCRPLPHEGTPFGDEFIWEGLDGSKIPCARVSSFYNQGLGKADEKIKNCMASHKDKPVIPVLWGVGNHGGGPSRIDLQKIAALQKDNPDIIHSTPEAYFEDRALHMQNLPVYSKSLNPCMPGCYISQIRIKQHHRLLENLLYSTEKMAAAAGLNPAQSFQEALQDLMLCQFHDVLPGSSIRDAEEDALRILGHGITEVRRVRMSAFLKLTEGFNPPKEGTYTLMVYNPHPYFLKTTVTCEMMLADVNWNETTTVFEVYDEQGVKIPAQIIKERSNLPLDWRKKLSFDYTLAPMAMHQFTAVGHITEKPLPVERNGAGKTFSFGGLKVAFDEQGALCRLGDLLTASIMPVVFSDNADPWGMDPQKIKRFGVKEGTFKTLSPQEAHALAAIKTPLPPCRIIEEGEVLTRVETLMGYGRSTAVLHWTFYKNHPVMDLDVAVHWGEKDKLLKIEIPLSGEGLYKGEIPFGYEDLTPGGGENVSQKWVLAGSAQSCIAVVNNGTYATSFENGSLYLTLLRSPGYTAHPIGNREILPQDRLTPRMDQGERHFSFRFMTGTSESLLNRLPREAQAFNEPPYALSLSPRDTGSMNPGQKQDTFMTLDGDETITCAALFRSGQDLVLRLHNQSPHKAQTTVKLSGCEKTVNFKKFEIKTLILHQGVLKENTKLRI